MKRRPMRRLLAGPGRAAGVIVLSSCVALSGCAIRGAESLPLPGGPDLGDDPYEVRADFDDVLDLVPHSVVKVNDVSVGKVTDVELAGWSARVTFKLRRDVELPDNTVARIKQTSLLGEKFIDLAKPAAEAPVGTLNTGDVIPAQQTSRGTEIEEVLSAMSLLLNGGGLEQVSTITRELNAAMNGRSGTIKSVLRRVDTFVGTLDQNKADIVRALDSIDRLTVKLNAERRTIAETIDDTGPAIEVLNRNRADLTKMLVSLDRLSGTTTNVIDRSKADTLANLSALDKTLKNLNKAGDDLPRSLESMLTFPFPGTFGNVLKGDYGNLRLTVDLDMNSLARNLLGGTDLEHMIEQGDVMRGMLRPPSISVPQAPPGVLTSAPDAGAAPEAGRPGAAPATDPGLHSLMTGGLS